MITPELLGRAFGEAPDPELARIAFSRLGERPAARELLDRPEIVASAAPLLGFSRSAADFFLAHPEELEALADPARVSTASLEEEAIEAVRRLGDVAGLRRFRKRASYRVASRDLAGAPLDDVVLDLTAIAEACLEVAVRCVDAGEMAVVGMGKLGGRELNYSSDVDVLFLHESGDAKTQDRASRRAGALIKLLSEPTADGLALRIDANLRPEGRAGALSRSLAAMLEYYERHAATWERQALLKARPVAGDEELAERFVAAVTPFVYPAVLPSSAIEDVRATKARIEERVRAAGKDTTELKRGRGGIRDVEFAVQLLQLVHGRRNERLRHTGTLDALTALAEEGFIAPADAESLGDSYRFLRRVEHRLQMVRDLQTHELPPDAHARTALARSLGLAGDDELRLEYIRHTANVRTLHERLFYRPLLEAFAGDATPSPGVDRRATEELLAGLGFADPPTAYAAFARIIEPSTRTGVVLATLFPLLAPTLAFAPLPDAALVRFERLVDELRRDDRIADVLADRPDAARRLAALVSASSAFADTLIARPALAWSIVERPRDQPPLFAGDPQPELLRVAAAYAAGEVKAPETGHLLSAVADEVVSSAASEDAGGVPLAVIALGKLGGREISFASDLDVVFVYDGEGPEDFRAASRSAERIVRLIDEAGWKPDPDLRPEGKNGPLARSLASYLEYWERWADMWEYQSLLRARFVAGDETLGRRFVSNAEDFSYPERLTFEQMSAIRRMRVRLEEERVRPADARRFHFKLGYGGLADVQFAVELSLMRHGFEHPEIRSTNTLEALEALATARLLEDSVARTLGEAYVFLTEIKNALEIERRIPQEAIPPTPEAQTALARRLGYGDRARHRFLQDYRTVTRRTRLAMERVFYGDEA